MKSVPIVTGRARRPIRPALISGFCSMKRLGVFLLHLDGILVYRRLLPAFVRLSPSNLPVSIYMHLGGERH